MANLSHTELVILSVLQETSLQIEQHTSLVLKQFSECIQGKSKNELIDINLQVLDMMQKNYKSMLFLSLCRQIIDIVEAQISKLEK